jgi:methylmalonyl-CoA/ethylmalonyl-CoA epimerase
MFARLDHVGLVAPSFEDALALFGGQLGLDADEDRSPLPDGVYFAPEQTKAYFFKIGDGETQIEVLVPTEGATTGTARFLERNGPGLHHLCYACPDIDAEAERLRARGLTEIELPRTADGRRTAAFFHPKTAGGVLTELVPMRLSDLPTVGD